MVENSQKNYIIAEKNKKTNEIIIPKMKIVYEFGDKTFEKEISDVLVDTGNQFIPFF